MSATTETPTPKIVLEAIRESGCRYEVQDEEWMLLIRITTPPGKVFKDTYRHYFRTLSVYGTKAPGEQWAEVLSAVIGGFDDCPYEDCEACRKADVATNERPTEADRD